MTRTLGRLSLVLVLALLFPAPATSEVTFWRDQLSEIPLPAPPESDADPSLRAAFDALTRQRLPDAIGSFEQYFARGGNTAYARASFARALFQAGRRAEAQEQAHHRERAQLVEHGQQEKRLEVPLVLEEAV